MSEVISIDRPDFKDLRDSDGYYRDGLEVLRRALVWINSAEDRDEYQIPLPPGRGAVLVMYNGGVPFYLTNAAEPHFDNFTETTATGAVAALEGHHA